VREIDGNDASSCSGATLRHLTKTPASAASMNGSSTSEMVTGQMTETPVASGSESEARKREKRRFCSSGRRASEWPGRLSTGATRLVAVVLALVTATAMLWVGAPPAFAAGSLTQVAPFTGSVVAGTAYNGQLAVTGNTGAVTYTTTVSSPSVSVAANGAVTSPGSTSPPAPTRCQAPTPIPPRTPALGPSP
jgi:hypothetical protein